MGTCSYKRCVFCLFALQVFIFSRSEVAPGVYECWGNFAESWGLKAYVTWMTVAIFILPVLIITVCQVERSGREQKMPLKTKILPSLIFLPSGAHL